MSRRSVRNWFVSAAIAISIGAASAARAANETAPMMQYLGYTNLYNTYGASLADGSNVSVSIDETNETSTTHYYPNTADTRFTGKTMTATVTATLQNGSSN